MSIVSGIAPSSASGAADGTPLDDGTLIYWTIGAGAAGSYTPDIDDAEHVASGVSIALNTASWSRDGNGWAYNSSTGHLDFTLPAKTTNLRKFILEVQGYGGSNTDRWHWYLNKTDAVTGWYVRLMRTGSWALELYEANSGETQRDVYNYNAAVNIPATFTWEIWDHGDALAVAAPAFETDGTASSDIEIGELRYFASSRFNKAVTTAGLRCIQGTNFMKLRRIQIVDVPD